MYNSPFARVANTLVEFDEGIAIQILKGSINSLIEGLHEDANDEQIRVCMISEGACYADMHKDWQDKLEPFSQVMMEVFNGTFASSAELLKPCKENFINECIKCHSELKDDNTFNL